MKKKLEPSEVFSEAEFLLRVVGGCKGDLADMEAEAQAKIQEIADRYSGMIAGLKGLADEAERNLLKHMKAQRAVLFDGRDIVRTRYGTLIHGKEDKVSIPRDALAKCEELGLDEVIKIAKSIDREAVEKWPDEKLLLIGAERKPKETFSYDLSGKGI